MITKLTILTLDGCSFCNKFKDLLRNENINFLENTCSKNSRLCDSVESYTGCTTYPMAIIETNRNAVYTICISSNYEKINKTVDAREKGSITYLHSINTMLDFIKKV
jgi:glutaredoxin